MEPDSNGACPEHLRIGGNASPDEIAAVVAALAQTRPRAGVRLTPAWLRAGLAEGLGGRPPAEPADLRSGTDGMG